MLTTLGPNPIVIIMRTAPVILVRAKWITARPRRQARSGRMRLSEGVWIVPRRSLAPPEWMHRGLCAALPPAESDALFFGMEVREAPGALIAAANAARAICARCPVEVTCLTNALTADERYGVWGGTSGRQREKMRLRLAAGAAVDELVRECLPARALSA